MDTLLGTALSNAAIVAVLAPVVSVFGRISRRPALVHSLWLLVLLKLFTPPLWPLPLSKFAHFNARQATNLAQVEPQSPGEPLGAGLPIPPPEGAADGVAEENSTSGIPAEVPFDRTPVLSDEGTAIMGQSSPVTLAVAVAPTALSWRTWLFAVWLAGSSLWLTVAAYRIYRFRRLLHLTQRAPPSLQTRVRRLAERLELTACPEVWIAPAPISPLLWALTGAPRLLVPESLLHLLTEEQWDTLLAHELAHLRRGDHWVRFLELASLGMYWWHPMVWWARRELREAEEQCCDAWVVWALPGAAEMYASTLVEAVTYLSSARTVLPLAASGIGHMHLLKRRLTMIMRGTTPRALSTAGSLAVLGLAAVLLPLYPSWAQTGQRKEGGADRQTTDPTATTGATADAETSAGPGATPQDDPAPSGPLGRSRAYGPNNPRFGSGAAIGQPETAEDVQDEVDLLRVQLDSRRAERREVQARLRQAQNDMARLGKVPTSQADNEHARTEVEVQEARLAAKDAQVKEAELRLKQAERRQGRSQDRRKGFGTGSGAAAGRGTFGTGGGVGAGFGPSSGSTAFPGGTGGGPTGGIAGFSGGQAGGFAGGGGFSGMGPGFGPSANLDQRLQEVEKKLQTLIDEMKALRERQSTDRQRPKD